MARRIYCGINTDPKNPDGNPSVQEIRDLGADWVRFTFKDPQEANQPTTFGDYDQLIHDLHQAGIHILLILSYETYPNWPRYMPDHPQPAAWQTYRPKFAARCRQIAAHYGSQVSAYEIWNEPDHQEGDYNPRVRAEFFGPLLKAAYEAVKAESDAPVVLGGLASGQPPYVTQVKASTGGVLWADGLGVHPYGRRPDADWPPPDSNGNPWGAGVLADLVVAYHQVAQKPIWVTEVGINAPQESFQAEFVKRTYRASDREPLGEIAPYVFWYCWSHGMGQEFGLVGPAGQKRPAYDEFRAFATQVVATAELTQTRLQAELLRLADAEQRIQFNPTAALQRHIFADGLSPNSGEFRVPFAGISYSAQRAEHLGSGEVRVYHVPIPLWDQVSFVTRPRPQDAVQVSDSPSVHSIDRGAETVRYIIVQSTDSAVGAPATETLSHMVGPTTSGETVHELVLPGGVTHRLVPDNLAAKSSLGPNAQLPDGTAGERATKAVWAVAAYQVAGKPVGAKVLSATSERIVDACQRLGLDESQVLGAGEVDPDVSGEPNGVSMDDLRGQVRAGLLSRQLVEAAEANQLIQFNPAAALQAAIFSAGFVPNSPEFQVDLEGRHYVAQRAEHLDSGKVRVYYAATDDLQDVQFAERDQ
jgi:hypothetical protein